MCQIIVTSLRDTSKALAFFSVNMFSLTKIDLIIENY